MGTDVLFLKKVSSEIMLEWQNIDATCKKKEESIKKKIPKTVKLQEYYC